MDTLLAVLAVAVLVTLGAALLAAVTVAPLVVALGHAARLRASPARTGAVAGLTIAVGLGLAARTGATAAAAVPLLLPWAVPVALARAPATGRLLGRTGRHVRS